MKVKSLVFSAIGALFLTSAAHAADHKKPVNSWTCEDFQPTAVGVAEALNSKDKPEDAVLNVSGIEKVTPTIVQACQKDKKMSFKDKVRAEWDNLKKEIY